MLARRGHRTACVFGVAVALTGWLILRNLRGPVPPDVYYPDRGFRDKYDLSAFAVGVNTGGAGAAAYVDALRAGHLRHYKQLVIFADKADARRDIHAPPPRFYCTPDSAMGPTLDGADVWTSRGRCTQLRFLYIVLTLRDEFPGVPFYLLLDDDTWVDPFGLDKLLRAYNPDESWLMGPTYYNQEAMTATIDFVRRPLEERGSDFLVGAIYVMSLPKNSLPM